MDAKDYYSNSVLLEAWNESNAPIGKYIINEDFNEENTTVEVTKDPRTGKPVGHAIYQSAGVRNRNGRIYGNEDLTREVYCPRTKELLRTKNLFCEAGHPIDTSLQRQSTIDWRNSNCKILTLDMVGNNVEGTFTPSNTPLGKAFEEDLREGTIPAFSLRALGSIRQVTDLRMITYDQVIYPSHSNAYMTNLVNESTDIVTEQSILTEASINQGLNRIIPVKPLVITEAERPDLVNFIKNNSNNLRFINDYFGTKFENVTITPNGSTVTVQEVGTNNHIVMNLEYYIQAELMNYASNIGYYYSNEHLD